MENSTTLSPSFWVEPRGLMIFRLIFDVSIAVAGIIGNALVCVVIIKSLKTKTSMNTFLLSLATADLGVLLLNFPIAISKEQSPSKYIFGRFFCLYIAPATETFFCASIWSITAIAVDRYRNIVGTNRLRRTTVKATRCAIVAIWTSSFITASLPLYATMDYTDGQCGPVWPNVQGRNIMMQAYNISLAVVWYMLPLVIISFTYLRIRQKVSQSIRFRQAMREEIQGRIETTRKRQLRENKKTKTILSPLVILFATTMLPITSLRLVILYVSISLEYFIVVYNISVICVITNSAINPIVYYIVSKEFRLAYQAIINSLCTSCSQPLKITFRQRWSVRRTSTGVDTGEEREIQTPSFEQHENRPKDNDNEEQRQVNDQLQQISITV